MPRMKNNLKRQYILNIEYALPIGSAKVIKKAETVGLERMQVLLRT